jgi:hypothetical protein
MRAHRFPSPVFRVVAPSAVSLDPAVFRSGHAEVAISAVITRHDELPARADGTIDFGFRFIEATGPARRD